MDRAKVRKVTTAKYKQKDRKLTPEGKGIFEECEVIKSSNRHRLPVKEFPPLDLSDSAAHTHTVHSLLYSREAQPEEAEDTQYAAEGDLQSLETELGLPPDQTESGLLFSDPNVQSSANRETQSVTVARNSYLQFLNKPEHLAATWRPKEEFVLPSGSPVSAATPLLLDSKKTLSCKAKDITRAIIKDFCQWTENLGGVEKSEMTEDVLHQLFEIGFDAPATRALCVRFKELPFITQSAAQAFHLPERSVSAGLRREILKDIRAESKPARLIGFGTALHIRPPLVNRPPRNQTKKRWLNCRTIHKDLESMQVVWQGITNLRSTKSYCQWLNDYPSVPRPPYLVQQGMFRRNEGPGIHPGRDVTTVETAKTRQDLSKYES